MQDEEITPRQLHKTKPGIQGRKEAPEPPRKAKRRNKMNGGAINVTVWDILLLTVQIVPTGPEIHSREVPLFYFAINSARARVGKEGRYLSPQSP